MPVSFENLNCFGCGACESICPQNAIVLKEDKESFLYPCVDYNLCNNCNLCVKVCPLHFDSYQKTDVLSYVGMSKDFNVNFSSSSGGAFSSLCKIYCEQGYKIYGVQFDDNHKVIFGSSDTYEECKPFFKSKYIQCYYNDIYEKISDDLKSNNKVVFSGVSCQCAALISYLNLKRINRDNLLIINVLCHGVPSQRIFDSYIHEIENLEDATVEKYTFKNKRPINDKINTRTACIEFNNGKRSIVTSKNDPYLRGYYNRLFYRPSCLHCKYARRERLSDFTIADAWNINEIKPKYRPVSGVSLILFNTDKAKIVFNQLTELMDLEQVSSEWVFDSQSVFYKPTESHRKRKKFFVLWPKYGFRKAVFLCTRPSLKQCIIILQNKLKLKKN